MARRNGHAARVDTHSLRSVQAWRADASSALSAGTWVRPYGVVVG